jgi:transposase
MQHKTSYIKIQKVLISIWRNQTISEDDYGTIIKHFPKYDELKELVSMFRGLVKERQEHQLDKFIQLVKLFGVPELDSFVGGIMRDETAVRNALKYQYSNGITEGNVNRLKTIKRMMYSRAKIDLLKQKVCYRSN